MKKHLLTYASLIPALILISIFGFKDRSTNENCIVLVIPDIEYDSKYIQSVDSFPEIKTFDTKSIKLACKPTEYDFYEIERITAAFLKSPKQKAGIAYDVSRTNYNGFIRVLNLFIKYHLKKIRFDLEKDILYYYPFTCPKELAFSKILINPTL